MHMYVGFLSQDSRAKDLTALQVVLDAFEPFEPATFSPQQRRMNLLLLSANTPKSLETNVDKYRAFIGQNAEIHTSDFAYTLALRREKLAHRAFALVHDGTITNVSSSTHSSGVQPPVYLIFTGQGAQWAGMAKELIEEDGLFKKDICFMDAVLSQALHPPSWTILGKMTTSTRTSFTAVARSNKLHRGDQQACGREQG